MSESNGDTWARDLNGQVAWVTGAGTGIGEAAAEALARAGMTVVLSGRRAEPLQALAMKLTAAGLKVTAHPIDVVDRDAMLKAGWEIAATHGRIDLLFGNAGINLTPRNWKDATDDPAILEEWEQVLDINVKGVWNGIAAVLPTMRAQGDGLIVTTSSMAGVNYSKVAGVPYGASKHAVMSLSAHVNSEEGNNGIRATAICPGEVATPILDRRPIPVPAEDIARLIQPWDIAEVLLLLARMPARTRLNEILVTPTYTRAAFR
jgi:NADP-dependent 3-hydroxy acid dehydrogenase YdfG